MISLRLVLESAVKYHIRTALKHSDILFQTQRINLPYQLLNRLSPQYFELVTT